MLVHPCRVSHLLEHPVSPNQQGHAGGETATLGERPQWLEPLIPPSRPPSQPENVVYAGPSSASPKRVTLRSLRAKYANKEPISMVTAYDYPSAVHVSERRGGG